VEPFVEVTFEGEVIEWRGPAPFHFVAVPPEEVEIIRDLASAVSYGWGVIPAHVRIGATDITTSLFPRHGGYLVPLKDAIRRAESIELGDVVAIRLRIDLSRAR
jgi:hypothetical protein